MSAAKITRRPTAVRSGWSRRTVIVLETDTPWAARVSRKHQARSLLLERSSQLGKIRKSAGVVTCMTLWLYTRENGVEDVVEAATRSEALKILKTDNGAPLKPWPTSKAFKVYLRLERDGNGPDESLRRDLQSRKRA
jgi:hypothetical protein